ncbi:hypothetical protein NMY22_g12587 [Coprinellus aureogranulatus]|nr:hypothetical protein NMY22_g12587 [Coprinellus aureogranulatus]
MHDSRQRGQIREGIHGVLTSLWAIDVEVDVPPWYRLPVSPTSLYRLTTLTQSTLYQFPNSKPLSNRVLILPFCQLTRNCIALQSTPQHIATAAVSDPGRIHWLLRAPSLVEHGLPLRKHHF